VRPIGRRCVKRRAALLLETSALKCIIVNHDFLVTELRKGGVFSFYEKSGLRLAPVAAGNLF
jgi:hypothetical protein